MQRFSRWSYPRFDGRGFTKWGWMCQHREGLKLGRNTDVGAFSYINARYGVEIQEGAQLGSHVSIYSHSTIDGKRGKVTIKRNAKVGSHSVVMPGVTIGEGSVVGALSFVNRDVPPHAVAFGIPVKIYQRTGKKKMVA